MVPYFQTTIDPGFQSVFHVEPCFFVAVFLPEGHNVPMNIDERRQHYLKMAPDPL